MSWNTYMRNQRRILEDFHENNLREFQNEEVGGYEEIPEVAGRRVATEFDRN